MRVVVHPDPTGLSEAVAGHLSERIGEARERGITIGLAGGSTPAAVYRMLGERSVDWARTDLWLSDERWVPHDHADSNGRMAIEALGPEAGERLLRPTWSERLEPADAAAHYEAAIRAVVADGRPDVTLLGMGADGHTASLFPGTPAVEETARWFIENHVPKLDAWRLTATRTLINASREVIVLVTGDSKAETIREVLEEPGSGHPIQLLTEASGEVVFHLDADAASRLESTPVERPPD